MENLNDWILCASTEKAIVNLPAILTQNTIPMAIMEFIKLVCLSNLPALKNLKNTTADKKGVMYCFV